MKLVIQRVTNASVSVDGSTVGSIGKGLLVLVGVEADDTDEMLPKFVNKMLKLRIFEDENGKKKPVLNKKETAIAQDRQELIKQKFAEWIWKDINRRELLCRIYN